MTKNECLEKMKAPGDRRQGIWRGKVLQVKWLSACNLACNNCTAGVAVIKDRKKVWWMTPDQFRTALRSLKGFGGVIGAFGGNPCLHPKFEEMCAVFREEIPDIDQRGLWSNNLMGHAKVCRETFSPHHSNLNVHGVGPAFEKIKAEWPEAFAARSDMITKGATAPSMHGSWMVALKDVIPDEGVRWDLISRCEVNQRWSAQITVINGELRGYFCEWIGTREELDNSVTLGVKVEPGWWAQPMSSPGFSEQACHHCHRCSAPLNPKKIRDLGNDPEDYSISNAALVEGLKRPVREVKTLAEVGATDEVAVAYLGDVVLARK